MQEQDPLVEYATVKAELDGLLQNRKVWLLVSVVVSLWLLPYGVLPFLLGFVMWFAGTRWFHNHMLSKISEHELYLIASRIGISDDE